MGIASLVLGIVSVVISFIPFCGVIALVPAIVGLILGIIDTIKKSKEQQPKGMSIAGTVCSAVAIVLIIYWYVAAAATVGSATEMMIESMNSVL